jgi:hypothetical protein
MLITYDIIYPNSSVKSENGSGNGDGTGSGYNEKNTIYQLRYSERIGSEVEVLNMVQHTTLKTNYNASYI